MKILFAAPENTWGGFLHLVHAELPEHTFASAGGFDSMRGIVRVVAENIRRINANREPLYHRNG